MKIQISAGGIGGVAVMDFQSQLRGYIGDTESVISGFKAITSGICNLSGGVGSLQDALDQIDQRVSQEEAIRDQSDAVERKTNEFLELARQVDGRVAANVNQNKEELYRCYPQLQPVTETEEESWGEKALNWLCGVGEAIAEKVEQGWNWVKDTAKKAWDGLVEFYNEHKKIIDTVLIVIGAVVAIAAVVASGGTALVPLLGALGFSTGTAMAISATVAIVAVVSTVASSTLNIIDTWAEIDNPTFNAWQTGLNITSAVTNFAYSIGSIYNTIKGYKPLYRLDWEGYPEGAPKPEGYYRILQNDEYDTARKLANVANKKLHNTYPEMANLEFHEILPVKFGGSPTNINNKIPLTPEVHRQFTVFWNRILKGLQ